MSEDKRTSPLTIAEQAMLVRSLVSRGQMQDGSMSGSHWALLDADTLSQLDALANRLDLMAPHERDIRRVVAGR